MFRSIVFASLTVGATLLAGCESSEERAQDHFQEGVALLEAGDVDRALVEFRNVFRLDGRHKEARRLYAQAEIERGNIGPGYSQYLRLVEQYPDDLEARRQLTQIALSTAQWDEVERHSEVLLELDPDDPVGRLSQALLRYRAALEAEDTEVQAEVVEIVGDLREALPEESLIPEFFSDIAMRQGRYEEALQEIESAIALSDDPRRLYTTRLALLQQMGDFDAVESGLREIVNLYPDDQAATQTLIRWYLSRNEIDKAESFLRERAENGGMPENIDVVRFLRDYRGNEVAITKLDELIGQADGDTMLYKGLRASLRFETGDTEPAIAEMQTIVDETEQDSDDLRNIKATLARMLEQTGNRVGARALVEDVLATDPNHVEAVKMQAGWLIDADETDDAILSLRTALEQNPRDPSLMTLMARAYERSGNTALMAEMLSLAVEVSNRAPAETLRYARFLVADDKANVAERAIVDSLRLNPDNQALLSALGGIYINQQDWPRAEQVVSSLAAMDTPEAQAAVNEMRARILAGQGRSDEVIGYLESLVQSGEAGVGAEVGIVRTHVQNGDLDLALDYVEGKLASQPEQPAFKFLKGAILELTGQPEEAADLFAEITEQEPQSVLVWRALYLLQQRAGQADEAAETLSEALEANPESPDLQWIAASELQRQGDFEGALDIYAAMYERNTSNLIVANNYASLLSMIRDDQESIDRAYAVARRLQGSEVAAFQDTFGWITYLRGDAETAVEYLEPAAAELAGDPSVHYHLAMAYSALDRDEDAVASLKRALELAEEEAVFPYFDEARLKLAELKSAGE